MNGNIDNLNDDELLQLMELSPKNKKTHALIKQAEEEESIDILLDEATGAYWHRRVNSMDTVDEQIAKTLLACPSFSTARSVLGDAARENKLDRGAIAEILGIASHDEWFYKQVLARNLLDRFVQQNASDAEAISTGFFTEILYSLIGLKTCWAVLELLPLLTHNQRAHVMNCMEDSSALNRHDRHRVREATIQLQHREGK